VCGLVQIAPGAEELCHWEPTCAHASNSRTGAQGSERPHLFKKALKLSFKKARGGLFNILPQFWERAQFGFTPHISMLGRCRKDLEQSGL